MNIGPNQEKWLQALESGDYFQCRGVLESNTEGVMSYCCLGVANEVLSLQERSLGGLDNTFEFLGLRECLGLLMTPAQDPNTAQHATDLSQLNDKLRWTFSEIADYIRANPDNVFKESK